MNCLARMFGQQWGNADEKTDGIRGKGGAGRKSMHNNRIGEVVFAVLHYCTLFSFVLYRGLLGSDTNGNTKPLNAAAETNRDESVHVTKIKHAIVVTISLVGTFCNGRSKSTTGRFAQTLAFQKRHVECSLLEVLLMTLPSTERLRETLLNNTPDLHVPANKTPKSI